MRLRVAVFGVLGTVATVLAAIILFAPDLVGLETVTGIAGGLGDVNTRHLLLVTGVLVGLFLSLVGWNATRTALAERDAFDEATDGPPESVTTVRQDLTAAHLDGVFDAAIAGDDEATDSVRERLRETATRAYARANGTSLSDARGAVHDGTWTDDRTAAAALAQGDSQTHSVPSRLRLWLDPESERKRRFERAVEATTKLDGGDQ